MLTQKRLKELLLYDPKIGIFTRRKPIRGMSAGSICGSPDKDGYIQVSVDKKRYKAHRLAWLYVYGNFPPNQIDHINRIKDDNRIDNLRLATNSQNSQNQSKRKDNKSGVVGVGWSKRERRWRARIVVDGREICLGYYRTIEEAALSRSVAKLKIHTFCAEITHQDRT
jgi:hypothetical protein